MTSYRCHRDAFTQEQFDKYRGRFWMMPSAMGSLNGDSLLAKLWKLGRAGAISVLPILGQFGNSKIRDALKLSKEELARLGGIDVGTVRRGEQALLEVGLVPETATTQLFGKTVTVWRLDRAIAVPSSDDERRPDYFYFDSHLIYGGNWARLTPVQRAVYLAVGSQARTYSQPVADNPLLAATLAASASSQDLLACHSSTPLGELRLALISFSQLHAISGVSKTALHTAVNALKRPDSWPGVEGDAAAIQHAPLAVYPTGGGSLIYHIRDHAPHWPWDELNRQPELVSAAVAGDDNWSDDLELVA